MRCPVIDAITADLWERFRQEKLRALAAKQAADAAHAAFTAVFINTEVKRSVV